MRLEIEITDKILQAFTVEELKIKIIDTIRNEYDMYKTNEIQPQLDQVINLKDTNVNIELAKITVKEIV